MSDPTVNVTYYLVDFRLGVVGSYRLTVTSFCRIFAIDMLMIPMLGLVGIYRVVVKRLGNSVISEHTITLHCGRCIYSRNYYSIGFSGLITYLLHISWISSRE